MREARTGDFLHNLGRFVIQNGRLKNCLARQQVLLKCACLSRAVVKEPMKMSIKTTLNSKGLWLEEINLYNTAEPLRVLP